MSIERIAAVGLIVVDVGNTRIKWGRCEATQVIDCASLPPDDLPAWQVQLQAWGGGPWSWAVSGVHPARRDRLLAWLQESGQRARLIDNPEDLSLTVAVERPDHVGIDRLLNAVAANARRERGQAAAIVDAGSAVTVDFVDQSGIFRGGAILPGFRLMAKALHDYTALLPVVEVSADPPVPAPSTIPAMQAGILHAVVGGARSLVSRLQQQVGAAANLHVFLTGGDSGLIKLERDWLVTRWPAMTLEGIRLTANALGVP
jgi:type III pantothenate kinase